MSEPSYRDVARRNRRRKVDVQWVLRLLKLFKAAGRRNHPGEQRRLRDRLVRRLRRRLGGRWPMGRTLRWEVPELGDVAWCVCNVMGEVR